MTFAIVEVVVAVRNTIKLILSHFLRRKSTERGCSKLTDAGSAMSNSLCSKPETCEVILYATW